LNWSLLRIGVIDELVITISPRIVGGVKATTLVEGKGFERISEGIKLELVKAAKQENGEVVLSYKL
jgi:2,5-diamino-6-(ribosylamino)-4(3H)-pyrimidinone 5'-phosphate reductase